MARTKIPYQSDVVVRLVAPTDVVNQNPLDNTNDGATADFKVFDPDVDETFSAVEASGQTEWSVTNAGLFAIGDVVEATETDGSILVGTLTAVDASAGTITSDTALAVGAAAGARVRVRLGTQISMTEYGTAALGTRDWGFQGTLPDTHPGLDIDKEIDIEIEFDGGAGLALLKRVCAVVKVIKECC